jgi:hypothetical protein
MNDGALMAVKKLYIRLCAARDIHQDIETSGGNSTPLPWASVTGAFPPSLLPLLPPSLTSPELNHTFFVLSNLIIHKYSGS